MEHTLYKDELLDHYRHPRHYGELASATIVSQSLNPSCGDSVSVYARFDGDNLAEITFTGKGCVISQAAASLLLARVTGQSFNDVSLLDKNAMLELVGIPLGPTRLRCALLALEAVQEAIAHYLHSIST